MKLSQLIESFVISNDEFVDYLDRATEQLAQEVQSGKNPRDAVHDLALQFANQHNKAYDAYMRMSDSLFARLHTLELDSSESTDLVPADMMNEPMSDMNAMNEPEMGGMDMDIPAEDEMPSDSDMEDYAAVMDNEPEAEEMEESSCGSTHKKKIREAEGEGTYARVSYEYSEDWGSIDLYKNHNKVAEWDGYFGANETGNPLARKFVEMCKEHGFDPMKLQLVDENGDIGKFDGKTFKWEDSVTEEQLDDYYMDVAKAFKKENPKLKLSGLGWTKKGMIAVKDMNGDEWEYNPRTRKLTLMTEATMGSIEVKTDEERAGRAALANLRKIVDEKQARSIKLVDGSMKVDMFTASAIINIYDAVNDANKAKIINMLGKGKAGILKVADIAMKLHAKNEGALGKISGAAKAVAPLAKGVAKAAGTVVGGAVSTALDKTGSNQTAKAYSDLGKSLSYKKKPVKTESVEDKAAKIMESAINRAGKSKK